MLKSIFTLILSGTLMILTGQNSFHRVYTVDPGHHTKNQTAVQLADGNFVSLDLLEDTLRDAANDLLITLYDKKGGILSRGSNFGAISYRLTTLDRKDILLPQKTSIGRLGTQFVFTALLQKNDSIQKLFGSMNPAGDLTWLNIYKTGSQNAGVNSPFLMSPFAGNLYLGTNQRAFTRSLVSLAKSTPDGFLDWSSQYLVTRDSASGALINNTLTTLEITKDSTMLTAGFSEFTGVRLPFIMESDTLGNMIWSKMYLDTLGDYYIRNNVEALKLADSTFVLACHVDSVNHTANSFGLILKTDTLGNVAWARKLTFGDSTRTVLQNLAVGNDGQIVVSGIMRDSVNGPEFHWLVKITLGGEADIIKKYPRVGVDRRINGNLVAAMDNGYAIFSTVDDGGNYLNIIKTDINGSSSCETEYTEEILSPVDLTSADLFWAKFDSSEVERTDLETDEYSLFPPIVKLNREPTYCPKDTINHLFDATVKDAVYYKWSNGVEGDSASMITVMDTESYNVMVTVDNGRECFTLCDTAQLMRFATPIAQINYSLGNFCTTGLVTLTANAFAEAGIQSILWNTGATTSTIEVGQAGTYSVTITDNCDEIIAATFDLVRMPQIVTSVNITENFNTVCENGMAVLQATENSFGLFPILYKWSNDATTQFISITEGGTYCVTVTDICGNTATSCIDVDQAKFRLVDISDVIVDQTNRCVNNTVTAEVFFTGDANIRWSTGETTKSVIVDMGVYSTITVYITDKVCPNNTDSFRVTLPQIQFIDPIEIVFDEPVECVNNEITLTVIYDQNKLRPSDASILWSTGETTQSIVITGNGTYAVTVVDRNCAINRAGAVLNFVFPLPVITLEPDSSALCSEGVILLNALLDDSRAPIDNPSFLWNTGETTSSIVINKSGKYTVTVTDPQCVINTDTAEFNFVFPNAGMKFAAVFFPNTRDTVTMEYNATFGPYLGDAICPESIEDYEFYIFNRWGQKVFESFDIMTEWNGTMQNENESNNPTEVYIWAVKYTLFGLEFKDHGDVTLIRQ